MGLQLLKNSCSKKGIRERAPKFLRKSVVDHRSGRKKNKKLIRSSFAKSKF
jgi:hypothetical protein